DGSFAVLSAAKPAGIPSRAADCYAVEISSFDNHAIVRFAASVFWRASVSARFPKVTLGRYEESFRAFLSGSGSFASDSRLILSLIAANGSPVDRVTTMPVSWRASAHHHEHVFIVTGLHFLLAVGGKVPPAFDLFCIARSRLALVTTGGPIHERLTSLASP